jgi:hypothetical protein
MYKRCLILVGLAIVATSTMVLAEPGTTWFKFPGTKCVQESTPEDGWVHTNSLQSDGKSGTYEGSSFINEMVHIYEVDTDTDNPNVAAATEAFCPVPYMSKAGMDEFGEEIDFSGGPGDAIYFDVEVYVIDNNSCEAPSTKPPWNEFDGNNFTCNVLVANGGSTDEAGVFDWYYSEDVKSTGTGRQILRFQVLDADPPSIYPSKFITIHCIVPGQLDKNDVLYEPSQLVGYTIRKRAV